MGLHLIKMGVVGPLEASTTETMNLVDGLEVCGRYGLIFQGRELSGFETHQLAYVCFW